jgi:hypothetical protein
VAAALIGLLALPGVQAARADWVLLPESRDHQFRTFGLFIDSQSSLLLRDSARAWGSIAGNFALLEATGLPGSPQLVLFGSANSGFRLNPDSSGVFTETIDARIGLMSEWRLSGEDRLAVGWMHQSGHASDEIPDRELFGTNLGNEELLARYVRDLSSLRAGGTLKPFVSSDPGIQTFAADQFVEWFFLGRAEGERGASTPTPYLALGIEEYGHNRVQLSGNAQLGAYLGSHFSERHHTSLRMALGLYDGVDPRLKYAQFRDRRARFFYFGLMFDL